MGSTDLDLLSRYARLRDAGAFAELAARHRDLVYGTCYRVLRNRADAEDVTQDCFLGLARKAATVRASVPGWLHRVAVNASLAARGKDRARERAEREAGSMSPDRVAEPTWEEITGDVDWAIDQLPKALREPVVLHFLQGKPQTVIAEELGISQPAVSRRLSKGIERLREHLGGLGLGLSAATLVALLETHTVEAAPAALAANLGRIALAGVPPAPAPGFPASLLGPAASMGPGSKVLCLLMVVLAVGAFVQQAVQVAATAHGRPPARQAATESALSLASPPLVRRPSSAREQPAAARRDDGPRSGKPAGDLPGPGESAGPGRPSRAARGGAPGLEASTNGPGSRVSDRPTVTQEAEPPASGPPREGAWGQADATPASPRRAIGLLSGPGPAGRPTTPPAEVVTASLPPEVDAQLAATMAEVIAVAKAAMEATFPERHLDQIRLVFAPARTVAHENVVTDRRGTIYIRVGEQGIGEMLRPDAGPVAILCEAVADLYNPGQLAGFNRFAAHRYLVPAVAGRMPDHPLQEHRASLPLAADGPAMLTAMADPLYSNVHPDFAAAAALYALEQELQLAGLRTLVSAIPPDAQDPFEALRTAAVAKAPQLAAAFAAYDEAMRLDVDEEGDCLIASFEPNETIVEAHPIRMATEALRLILSPRNRWSQSEEWSTHGKQSLCVEADEGAPWMMVVIDDADWKYKDWRRFSEFSFDFLVEAPEPQYIGICAQDHPTCGHGCLVLFSDTVEPGEAQHVSFPLNDKTLRGQQDGDATYFSGAFRADSVSRIYIGLSKPTQPITLYLDNLRLKVRPS